VQHSSKADIKKSEKKTKVVKAKQEEIHDIEKTVRWYLDNQEWMDNITSGEYEKYYEEMYKEK